MCIQGTRNFWSLTSSKIVIALQKLSVFGNVIEHKPFECAD